ncbi:MAG TPA: dehydrogenase [Planctomycetaceae bacterium]|nr:dehydrogenase [Planctomycetaceae bacterium]
MFIRLVDESSGGWGHINFDHFRLHPKRPAAVTPPAIRLTPDEYPYRGLAADDAAAAMQVPEGFRVQAIASEPDVKQPIAFALDDRGRVWVVEAYEYPQRAAGDKGRDRILIFEDTTGDGTLDSRKVFFDGLNLVSGLEVGHGGVWVGAAPYLLFIPDSNHDDVPDAEPQILLDGWGYQDTHETLNAFCWGPDGWLYGCHGVFTHSKVGVPGAPDDQRTRINAGVWRYHPKRHTFEVFAHGTSNPWGVDFNTYGDAFITACVIPHLYHMIPGGRYQRQAGQHFNPATYDDIKTIADHLHYVGATPHSGNGKSDSAGGGHAHAGAMIYQGDTWPAKYHGQIFMNNIHGQRLNVDALRPSGSGYVGTHEPDFLLTGDQASQILNMRYGPDGDVIMIDWYDMQACHRREVEVHDRSNGRIYKISYGEGNSEEYSQVDLAKHSNTDLAKLCLHSNEWYSRHARRLLAERSHQPDEEVAASLRAATRSNPDATRRLRAMWALFGYESWTDKDFEMGLKDNDPHVRGWAIRLHDQYLQSRWSESQLTELLPLARTDPSPIVRRELASLLMRIPPAKRWDLAAALIAHAEDADDHNLPLLYWYAIEPLAEENPDRALALAVGASDSIKLLSRYMLRRVAGSGGEDAVQRLTTALASEESPKLRGLYLSALRKSLLGVKQLSAPEDWPMVYRELIQADELAQVVDTAALSLIFGHLPEASRTRLQSVANDHSLDSSIRISAIEGLAAQSQPQDWSWFVDLGVSIGAATDETHTSAPAVAAAAIGALSRFDNPNIAKRLLAAYPNLENSGQRIAISTLCTRPAWAIALLKAIGGGKVSAKDLTADLARQLEYMESPDVDRLLAQHWGGVRATNSDKLATIVEYKKLITDGARPTPDLGRGRLIFSKTCQRCHSLYGVGQNLGPDLTGSNRKNLDYLLENIVDPSAVMSKEYQQTVILTVDGQALTGIAVEENQNALVLQTAESKLTIAKEDIELRKLSPLSMMPENQLQAFSESEIRDLIAYLRSQRQVELPAPTP